MQHLKKAILLGKKPYAAQALNFLLEKGIEVPFVVARDEDFSQTLSTRARELGIEVIGEEELYRRIAVADPSVKGVDLVISYLFWGRMREPLIQLGRRGCINLHPAPLPDYKSRAGYNTAILDGRSEFGVSAHFVDSEKFDAGPIIKVLTFPMDPETETVLSLEPRTQEKLFELFVDVINLFLSGKDIPTKPNVGGLYLTSTQLEEMKRIDPNESTEAIKRKIRAFFYPPYTGAFITIKGEKYTLLDPQMLAELVKFMRR